jgi:hypothetical protein
MKPYYFVGVFDPTGAYVRTTGSGYRFWGAAWVTRVWRRGGNVFRLVSEFVRTQCLNPETRGIGELSLTGGITTCYERIWLQQQILATPLSDTVPSSLPSFSSNLSFLEIAWLLPWEHTTCTLLAKSWCESRGVFELNSPLLHRYFLYTSPLQDA